MINTKKLYDINSKKWFRNKPKSLSDFTGRPAMIKLCGNIYEKKLLDIGCGEGYVARLLIKKNPKLIIGVDISKKMIDLANESAKDKRLKFYRGNIKKLDFPDKSFDIVLGVFVFNYLSINEMKKSMSEVFRVLKPSGKFIFSVPHPFLPLIKKDKKTSLEFNFNDMNYFSSRDKFAEGFIECIDKSKLPVKMNHKLIEDYFKVLKVVGFKSIPELHELKVKKKDMDKTFIKKNINLPLHLAFKISK